MNDEIVELQTRLAFQEDSIHELSMIVARQQQTLDQVVPLLQRLQLQVSALTPPDVTDPGDEPPPPHY